MKINLGFGLEIEVSIERPNPKPVSTMNLWKARLTCPGRRGEGR